MAYVFPNYRFINYQNLDPSGASDSLEFCMLLSIRAYYWV
jgi:hypothetical protein